MVGGGGGVQKNCSSYPEFESPKHFLWIAYLETSNALRELLSHLTPSGLYLFIEDEKCQIFRRKKNYQTESWYYDENA